MSTPHQRPPADAVGQKKPRARYPLALIYRADPYPLTLDSVARGSGLQPELVRRFVALGLVDARRDAAGRLWFRTGAPAAIARVQRLRTGLPLNYAAIGLVLDLLDRIDRLEKALRQSERAAKECTTWT
ncbi:chaperone modulator CbpM [Streptomyces sp. AK02-01A]|uniref:chaperone modulator CbpM n=1 Tax=Streptomyces sp. AK02-01A TaxID=3028648 RepID=UPI0029B612F4|nr:chaperone modulator CbpM [Streptomyces sp. AK02-01A]MDX3852766.1 chaperone modulator CbpM [Streptomyces sp. AK02-01A]